ncbi:MAG: hypothetical protein HS124_12850 [Anaerolineales bacterium]|nr:hypothetical protein [Anaerolineales bacterium]MCL4261410.1 hypothetical protein [Anaerolineales bacterium]
MSGVYALTMCAWICGCLAFGLPFAIAYADADLDDAGFDFLLKIPNKEDNIHAHGDAIREFAYRMRSVRVDRCFA